MLVILNCSLLHNQNDHESLVTTNPRRVTSQKNEDFKTHLGVNVKLPIFLPDFNQIWNFQDNFSQAYPVSNFKGNPSSWSRADTCGQTDMTKATGACRD